MGRFSSYNQPVAKAKKKSVLGEHLKTTKNACSLSKLVRAAKSSKMKKNLSKRNNNNDEMSDTDHTDMDTEDDHVKVAPKLSMEKKGPWGY